MGSVGITETTVEVIAGHIYGGTVEGAIGPVDVHDGDTILSPVIVRLRDSKRTFFWEPDGEGERKLLFTGWPGQRDVTVTVLDMGVVKKVIPDSEPVA